MTGAEQRKCISRDEAWPIVGNHGTFIEWRNFPAGATIKYGSRTFTKGRIWHEEMLTGLLMRTHELNAKRTQKGHGVLAAATEEGGNDGTMTTICNGKGDNDGNNSGWGNDEEITNDGVVPPPVVANDYLTEPPPSVHAKKLATASSLFQNSDTSEDKNNHNKAPILAPTNFIFSLATKRPRRTQPLLANPPDMEHEAREMASNLMRPLTPKEWTVVTNATKGIGPPTEILAKQGADSVQRGSMQTLRPGQWLNNEVINYFLKNCLARRDKKMCARDTGRRRSNFFNSFFVQTMFNKKNDNPKLRGRYNYKNVKSWSKKVPGEDIFNLKYILCPINLDNKHWRPAVIFMEDKRIQYYDSMGGTDRSKLEGLLEYVKDEYRVKNCKELDVTEWELVSCTRDTP